MAAFYASQKQREQQKELRKLVGLDIEPLDPYSLFDDEQMTFGFDLSYHPCPYTLTPVKSTWGDDYEYDLYGRLGLHCHNFQKGTNFKFVRWEKFASNSTAYDFNYVTLDAKDPATDSKFSFQTLLSDDSDGTGYISWTILACRIKCHKAVDTCWDDTAVDDFYKGAMPKWLSDEELACDNIKYYVVQESELQENDWLHLFAEIAFYSKTECASHLKLQLFYATKKKESENFLLQVLKAPPPLEIEKVVVVTKEDTTEAREKLKAKNAIFYISYKYTGESSSWERDHKAIIRKTMDGKPEHMCLEVACI